MSTNQQVGFSITTNGVQSDAFDLLGFGLATKPSETERVVSSESIRVSTKLSKHAKILVQVCKRKEATKRVETSMKTLTNNISDDNLV